MIKKKTKPEMPKLPESFTDNLDFIAAGLHGRPITANFAEEWKISEKNTTDLLQYLFDSGLITMQWLPEKQALCFLRKELVN